MINMLTNQWCFEVFTDNVHENEALHTIRYMGEAKNISWTFSRNKL